MKAQLIAKTTDLAYITDVNKAVDNLISAIEEDRRTDTKDCIGILEEITANPNSTNNMYLLGGKLAGVCYAADGYFSDAIQNVNKAINRANNTSMSGHHSVFEHSYMTILFTDIPKLMAMLLNSTEMYTTSEKSARYTKMNPSSDLELELYNKWRDKLTDIIQHKYSMFDEKAAQKLAQENARYMISVFTPTIMVYTVSYRQACYLIDWLDQLIGSTDNMAGMFNKLVHRYAIELKESLAGVLGEKMLSDNKNRYFEFLPMQTNHPNFIERETIADVYSINYNMSFAGLAQAQRHRTLHYEMVFDGDNDAEYGFYVPKIILSGGDALTAEWLSDMDDVSMNYPQGTLVNVNEQGLAKNFFLKCKERLCGRAQLEIMNNTIETMERFIAAQNGLSTENKKKLSDMTQDNMVIPRCKFNDFTCKEGCVWGPSKSMYRDI